MRYKRYISPNINEQSKHIDICHHYIGNLARNERLEILYIATANMIADGMTKPLQCFAFGRFKNLLGIVSI
jgi:hypothetical protein